MTIALATTTIQVRRPADSSDVDPWEREDAPASESLASGVRADISINTGRSHGPGDTQTLEFLLICDPTALTFHDQVIDEKTGQLYDVQWVHPTPGTPGLEHIQAGLKTVTGPGNP